MFAEAFKIASRFTKPIIISYRRHDGQCSSGIGTYVVVNNEGWCVTAHHILKQFNELMTAKSVYDDLVNQQAIINADTSLTNGQKRAKLGTVKIKPDAITNVSIWFGPNSGVMHRANFMEGIDLAIFKLDNFDPATVSEYPKFKDPNTPMEYGRSLCKLGFPLTTLNTTFDPVNQSFNLASSSNSLTLFPMEGIYTREVNVQLPPGTPALSYKLAFLETSSPGLRGQSGGPTFDIAGTVWAIQSQTMSWPLEFGEGATLSPKALEHLKHQFLNVGWGIHAATLIGFFDQNNISYNLAP